MDDPVANAILNQYFRRLEQALSGLSADRRQLILEDLRAHVEESLAGEPDRSEASLLAVLDRVGDPDEIAREAIADASDGPASLAVASPRRRRLVSWRRGRVGGALILAIAAIAVAVLTVTDGSSSAAPKRGGNAVTLAARIAARLGAGGSVPAVTKGGWLPAGEVSGDHHSPGASYCGPQTLAGSESAAALEAGASQVASGTVDGHSWSLWSRHGQSGANGLENGGVVVDGTAHGLCPGFPNPAEMELLDPSGGGAGLAYGVVGYPGAAKIEIYRGTVETFARGKLLATAAAQVVNGVGFFITALPGSACEYRSLEQNTTSKSDSAEHNLGFSTSHCSAGQLVPINWSQGIWAMPPGQFQTGPGGGAGRLRGRGAFSGCSPVTAARSSGGPPASLEAGAKRVASGTVAGQPWSLWSKHGEKGANALEDAGLVLAGRAYGMCPGFPNPAELEMIDHGSGSQGIVFGVSGYHGSASVHI